MKNSMLKKNQRQLPKDITKNIIDRLKSIKFYLETTPPPVIVLCQ